MKTAIINHLGKRAFDFRVQNGTITYQWIDYTDFESWDNSDIKTNNVVKTERVSKGVTKVFYN